MQHHARWLVQHRVNVVLVELPKLAQNPRQAPHVVARVLQGRFLGEASVIADEQRGATGSVHGCAPGDEAEAYPRPHGRTFRHRTSTMRAPGSGGRPSRSASMTGPARSGSWEKTAMKRSTPGCSSRIQL